jgi:hypothetical protein
MRQAMRTVHVLAAGAALLLLATGAQAQDNGYRAPAQVPMAMKILPKPSADEKARLDVPATQEPEAQGKFPNKDTAKNRQDVEFGTDSPGIVIGRDEKTGDTVVSHTPPKKEQQAPGSGMDITVKPVVRSGGRY